MLRQAARLDQSCTIESGGSRSNIAACDGDLRVLIKWHAHELMVTRDHRFYFHTLTVTHVSTHPHLVELNQLDHGE